jgi:VWFA-related protein
MIRGAAITFFAAGQALTMLMQSQGAPQTPTFRTQTNLVVVDVTVLAAGKPVAGLQTQDFQVLDNGIPQRVEFIASSAVPLDVSLLVETNLWPGVESLRFWDDVEAVGKRLRPGDRLGLTTFGTMVYEEFPLQTVPVTIPGRPSRIAGSSRLYDALAQAMVRPTAVGRRHLVMALTRGVDIMSVASPAQVIGIAKRCDAVVYLVLQGSRVGVNPLLDEVAYSTGGDVVNETGIARAFDKVIASLNAGYLLSYVPAGVGRDGWHDITVTVTRPGDHTVRARRGYFGG